MSCRVFVRYSDDGDLEVNTPKDKLKDLIRAINTGEMYFDEKKKVGLWIPKDKVRYIEIQQGPTSLEEEIKEDVVY